MDIKEAERVVVAKPVASRPTCSNFRSFTELLAGAIDSSPPNVCSDAAVAAIRPKTVRFKPIVNPAPPSLASSQAEFSGTAVSSDRVTISDAKPTVIYKPQAKLVSKTAVSILANMGNFSPHRQHSLTQAEAGSQLSIDNKLNFTPHITSNIQQNVSSHTEANQMTPPSRLTSQNREDDPRTLLPTASGDRPSYDGYNWRKYGQKQVKGSEYPRSYYKCTHPDCPVKKMVERTFDGQIAEIVYKGEHNHVKPQPPKRNSLGSQPSTGLATEGTDQDTNTTVWSNRLNEKNETFDNGVENQNDIGLQTYSTSQGKAPLSYGQTVPGLTNAGVGTPDNSCGLNGEHDDGGRRMEGDDDEPRSKRRKSENQSTEVGTSGEGLQEPRLVVESSAEPEILTDGFRWRKYGQKVVKGNPYPRSYYKCTSLKCNVRKHVERASDDPRSFITTYEGKHNHEMPLKTANPVASESDSLAPSGRDKA